MNRTNLVGPLFLSFIVMTGCGEDLFGASISSLTIDPSTITTIEARMTDEFFSVTLTVANFDDEIDSETVLIFRQEPSREDAFGEVSVSGNTITVTKIAKSWFGGVDAGTYNIGAEVESESQSIREFDLAVVTVEE